MRKLEKLRLERVVYMPEKLEPGVLYYSKQFELAIHLCACGECGQKTVTPTDSVRGWTISFEGELATLSPSIGNFQMPCRSHYFVRGGRIVWC